jgi:hypothetical protein
LPAGSLFDIKHKLSTVMLIKTLENHPQFSAANVVTQKQYENLITEL